MPARLDGIIGLLILITLMILIGTLLQVLGIADFKGIL
jgi:hypothetical protein